MGERRQVHQVRTDRRQAVILLGGVSLVAIIVLTIAQASIHNWFVYSAVVDSFSGAFAGTEWGMVALGILLGAGFALLVAYSYYRLYDYRYGARDARAARLPGAAGVNRNVYADLETGKAKFLSAKTTEHERDYVARYGQKAYQMEGGDDIGSMPQPLTPGHTSTLKIKALPEHDLPSPGRGWSLGRLLSYSWDSAKVPNSQQEHAQPSRLGGPSLSSAQSTASSIAPMHEPSLPQSTRAPTYNELANQISSPFGFLRAGSAIPTIHDHHGHSTTQASSEAHHQQAEGGQAGTPRKGAGLLGHMYNRKLEQAQQVQAAMSKLAGSSGPGSEGSVSANPRIMVLRESGDVEVNVELGDHENTADGSFMRTTMHRRRRTSSTSEAEEDVKGSLKSKSAVAVLDNSSKDGHAPEVVPADAAAKKAAPAGDNNSGVQSKKENQQKNKAKKPSDALADDSLTKQDSNKSKRLTSSPVFLSPATSLNSNSSGLSRHSSGGRTDFDSLAAAATAVATAPVKPAAKPVMLSSAALQKMDSSHSSSKTGKKAASVKSAKSVKSVKSEIHSRTSSVDWQDVELQSEGEDKAKTHIRGVQGGSRGVPTHAAKGSASAAIKGAETETDDGLSDVEGGGPRQRLIRQGSGPPEVPSSGRLMKAVALADLAVQAQQVRLVVCISLEQILPRPQAGLLSRMLRLADVPLVKGEDGVEPMYVVQPGGEYRIGVGLFRGSGPRKLQLQGASWLRIALPEGNSVTLPLDHDEENETGDWSGNTSWVLSQDVAKALAESQQTGSGIVPLQVTIGLQVAGKSSKRAGRHKPQEMHLPCTLKLKIIPRGNEAQSLLDIIDTYSPSEDLLTFWKKWQGSADDIQDCVVVCAK